jgi:DNA-directed RNA polymerase sigma subunit (sigma70/sigma32)
MLDTKLSWRKASVEVKREMCARPENASTLTEIAEEMELSDERARDIINKLVKDGRAEIIRGKVLSVNNTICNTVYYRLLSQVVKARKSK